jgi:APA family basic amino acid/polyamine antiporter
MEPAQLTEESLLPQQNNLLRILGVTFGLSIVIGGMIGGGILRTPGFVADQIGTPLLIIAIWILGGIYALFGANTFAELGTMLPKAGGPYVFARRTYGDYGGFLIGWSDWFLQTSTSAYLTVALGEYIGALFPVLADSIVIISISIFILLAVLNWIGLRMGSGIQKLTSLFKVVAFGFIVLACFIYGGNQDGAVHAPLLISSPMTVFAAFILSLQAVMETYAGWNNPVYFSEEDTNPEKNIPRVMFGGILIVMTIYVLFNLAMIYVLPMSELAASKLPAADAAQVLFGGFSSQFITSLALLSLVGILNVQVLSAPRIIFALSRDRLFFSKVATVNKGGTPTFALVLTVLISVILAATGTFESLLAVSAFMGLTVDSSVYLSLFILRKREPDLPRPFRARGYPLIPLIILVGSILLLVAYAISNTTNSTFALMVMVLSYPLFLIVRALNKKSATGNL